MAWDLELPGDVVDYVQTVFRSCNEQTSAFVTTQPNVHETTLDHSLIHHLNRQALPQRMPSEWVVSIETHFLGGGRHFGMWEIADIGFLVIFRKAGQVKRTKVGLLQCKRLYPNEQAYDEAGREDYVVGFGRLFGIAEEPQAVFGPRQYTFTEASRYKTLRRGSDQSRNIDDYVNVSGIPVFYLFYNPWQIPWSAVLPVEGEERLPSSCDVGCRVVPADAVDRTLAALADTASPSYADVCNGLPGRLQADEHRGGWALEHFVIELLMCREGYRSDEGLDARFQQLFGARTAPIAAALSITIDAP